MEKVSLPPNIELILAKKTPRTWDEFGILWKWAQEQEWWVKFAGGEGAQLNCEYNDHVNNFPPRLINPDRFSTAIYEFLKERNG